jgi:hypothetical protein
MSKILVEWKQTLRYQVLEILQVDFLKISFLQLCHKVTKFENKINFE